jgi:hypothetical protein
MLRKDASGHVTGILMPNQAQHSLEYRTHFNGYRLIYTGLHQQIWEYDSNGNLRRIYFPSQRMITYKYDDNNRLQYSFADGAMTSIIDETLRKTVRIDYPRGQRHEQIFLYRDDGTLSQLIDDYDDRNSHSIVSLKYRSVSSYQLRLMSTNQFDLKFFDNYSWMQQVNSTVHIDANTGLLQSNSLVRVTYPTVYECFIKDHGNLITLARRIDEYKRPKEISLSYKNQRRLSVEFLYNNKQLLLEQIKISVNELDRTTYSYQYDQFKRLVQVKKDDDILDSYQYDLNHNLNATKFYRSIEYNQWNQLIEVITPENRSFAYKYDKNGFIHMIGQDKLYLFNSHGLLAKYKSNQLLIEYLYDVEHRLVLKSYPKTGHSIQLIYGNLLDPHQITHLYQSQTKQITSLLYDHQAQLVGFEQNQQKFFVVTDSIGSPLFIYDHQGRLVQEKFYGLFGVPLVERNHLEKPFFPFGYAGLLIDEDLSCAFEKRTGKLFDLTLGKYLIPNFPTAWLSKRSDLPVLRQPLQEMNLYQIETDLYDFNEVFFRRLHQTGKQREKETDV